MSKDKAFLELTLTAFPDNNTSLTDEDWEKQLTDYVRGEMMANTTLVTEWGLVSSEEDAMEVDCLMGEAASMIRESEED